MRSRRFAPTFDRMDLRLAPSGALPMTSTDAPVSSSTPWVDLSGNNTDTPSVPYFADTTDDPMLNPVVPVYFPTQS